MYANWQKCKKGLDSGDWKYNAGIYFALCKDQIPQGLRVRQENLHVDCIAFSVFADLKLGELGGEDTGSRVSLLRCIREDRRAEFASHFSLNKEAIFQLVKRAIYRSEQQSRRE